MLSPIQASFQSSLPHATCQMYELFPVCFFLKKVKLSRNVNVFLVWLSVIRQFGKLRVFVATHIFCWRRTGVVQLQLHNNMIQYCLKCTLCYVYLLLHLFATVKTCFAVSYLDEQRNENLTHHCCNRCTGISDKFFNYNTTVLQLLQTPS